MKFKPTEKQVLAFKDVEIAIKKARKAGLVFYGKGDSLVAYTRQADDYVDEKFSDFEKSLGIGTGQIPCISKIGLIKDSGADDYPCFENEEDEEIFG